jgi:hypothetical protein
MGFFNAVTGAAKKSVPPPQPSFGGAVSQGASQGASHNFATSVSQGASQGATHNFATAINQGASSGVPQHAPSHTDAGMGYNLAQAEAFRRTAAYAKAIGDVFAMQPADRKQAILTGLIHNSQRADPWTTQAILSAAGAESGRGLGAGALGAAPHGLDAAALYQVEHNHGPLSGVGDLPAELWRAIKAPISGNNRFSSPYGVTSGSQAISTLAHPQPLENAAGGGLKALRDWLPKLPGTKNDRFATIAGSGATGPQADKIALGAAKDLVGLPGETLATAGVIGRDLAQKGPAQTLKQDIVEPFLHPDFLNHPLASALQYWGLLHGGARVAAAPVRALASEDSAVGRALSTKREGVVTAGNLTHERIPYSKSPLMKVFQAGVDKALYQRAPDGRLVPRSPHLRDKQINLDVSQLVGQGERVRRANMQAVKAEHERILTPGNTKLARGAARTAQAIKRAPLYGSKPALIPGAGVLARIADHTIRRPETFVEDIQKHLRDIAINRPNLVGDPLALKAHDANVKELLTALDNKRLVRNPAPAFEAADKLSAGFNSAEAAAFKLGHFGDLSREELERRALSPAVLTHWPGAHFDEELKTVVDRRGKPIPTKMMREFARKQSGGRPIAYVSHKVAFDEEKAARQAHFQGDRRPLPPGKRNFYYAYTHGLARPGHNVLTEQHVAMQGVVDALRNQNKRVETLSVGKPGGGYWDSHDAAMRDRPSNRYVAINISQPFHPPRALEAQVKDLAPASVEEEARRYSLELRDRLQPGMQGRWALIDRHVLDTLREHERSISPNKLLRGARAFNRYATTVALSTSAKHFPGIVQENLIRDVVSGVGFRSWVTGRRVLGRAEKLNPETGAERRVELTGGQQAGRLQSIRSFYVSDHWRGTNVHAVLRATEAMFKAPGPRQLRTAWQAYANFALGTTKHLLEEQHQIAGLGKAALGEHGYAEAARVGGLLSLFKRALGLHGEMLDDAAKGVLDPAKSRQFRAVIDRMYGKWMDQTPSAQTALMFAPFGMWWVNSLRWLYRMPIDHPVLSGLSAASYRGTEAERQKLGLDMFGKGALPLYMQGSIPLGKGKVLGQNYYSPYGTLNNPVETASSLVQPWVAPVLEGAIGVNWLGKGLSSPGNPHGDRSKVTPGQSVQYILDSALGTLIPFYNKAQQILSGGTTYNTTNAGWLPTLELPLKGKGTQPKGVVEGAKNAFLPWRLYHAPVRKSQGTNTFGGGTTSGGSGKYQFGTQGGTSTGKYQFGTQGGTSTGKYQFGP